MRTVEELTPEQLGILDDNDANFKSALEDGDFMMAEEYSMQSVRLMRRIFEIPPEYDVPNGPEELRELAAIVNASPNTIE